MFGLLLASSSVAEAQDTVDIRVLREEDIPVVQGLLHPKANRTELGFHLGLMPFDAYLTTPNVQLSVTRHLSERAGLTFIVGGGYGLETGVYRQLESPAYGVPPDVFRYLGSVIWGIDYSPIYGKLNLNGARVLHFDLYIGKRLGVTAESSVFPDGGYAVAPTFEPAIGGRMFLGESWALKVEFRDDLLVSYRLEAPVSEAVDFSQNANISVGVVYLSPRSR